MFFLYLLLLFLIYTVVKTILSFLVWKFGKISYDGFSAGGFQYDPYQDLFYSTKNAWQKSMGYTRIYDIIAPFARMTLDTLPILFSYNERNYLIMFWKGQYGLVTGAEIGVYVTDEKHVTKNTVYFPTSEEEMLLLEFTLYKKGERLIHIKAQHWWLAAFKLGVFSKPKDLSMENSVTFPNKEMLNAFLDAFCHLGYTYKDYKVIDTTFYFLYQSSRVRKVWTRTWLIDRLNEHFNKKNVEKYCTCLAGMVDDDKVDDSSNDKKRLRVQQLIPEIFQNKEEEHDEQVR